jgi:4-hydroxy 2-oxovalerate aldolase
MAHRKDVPLRRYRDLAELGVSMVRLPTRSDGLDGVADHVAAIRDAGMQASVNLIRVSELRIGQIAHAAAVAGRAGADVFYLADSNGALHPAEVTSMLRVVRDATGAPVGFHAHDGLSMAFANSLAALKAGCEYIDASLTGLGKGGGNLIMELLIGYLRAHADAPFDLTPLAHASADVVAPYRDASPLARCDSIVSSLLNLNLDEIANQRTEAGLLPLLNS